jgi:hypothetical protein
VQSASKPCLPTHQMLYHSLIALWGRNPFLVPKGENFSHGLATPPFTSDDSIEHGSVKSNDDALGLLLVPEPHVGGITIHKECIHIFTRDRMTARFCCLVSQRRSR